jgi:hypothetical protein
LQNPSQISGDNLQNLVRETSMTFRKKKREYLKGKVIELQTTNKDINITDLYRDINEFKKGCQPRISTIKGNDNLLVDSQIILNSRKHSFNQMLNVHGVHDVKLVEVEIDTGKLET